VAQLARKRHDAEAEVLRLGHRWQRIAAADELTGLGNRARFLEDAAALIARGGRYGHTFSLVVFDVGHAPTSEVALGVADVIAAQAREADLCYRITDGRFVTILPEQDPSGASLAASRVAAAINERTGVRVDSGTATFTPALPCVPADLLLRAEVELARGAVTPAP
jgi:GGDEF domain-containing protein